MFIFTAKLSKRKLAAAVIAAGALLIALILLLSLGKGSAKASATSSERPSNKHIESNEDRVQFLSGFGWEVDEQPLEFEEVLIPAEFDSVFTGYNDLQKTQGYDLSKYKGRRVMRYAYNVKNYPNVTENVRVCILVYKNTVIGGDVCSATLDGFMHGLEKP
ncbi:MAG: DUF4830 domain-containing protein [Oscillospiraceae bacterium]|nr:DUF4830 domain-containing protein [Oscillospiraceae bacterium]